MKQCSSVKKKGSTDQCNIRPVFGHILCGRHARMSEPVLWADVHQGKSKTITKCQALVRGWLVRYRLRMGGVGVLRRGNLINDEELLTMESKEKQCPYDYFSITENGKTWWFDFDTLYKWCLQSHIPTNPYSKVPLQKEARIRLRNIWRHRQQHKIQLPEESLVFEERVNGRWNILCQVFEDYGFGVIHPKLFSRMGRLNYSIMFQMIGDDIQVAIGDKVVYKPRIQWLIRRMGSIYYTVPVSQYILQSLKTLMLMTSIPKDPYILIFTILSALYRC